MQIDPYILSFSAFTVIATIWMGFWSARKSRTTSDFFVAGRSVGVGWNASAISGEYLSAASFMGVAGMVMSSGYDALWYPVCYACGYLFLLLFIAGPLRRFGAYTIPDFAEGRFDSPVFRKIAVVFVLFIGFFYTMPQMKGAGTTLAYIFPGLPYLAGVVLVGAVITLNVALGGMKGITLVQAFQYWAKMFAISVPIFVLMSVYGHYGKQVERNVPPSAPVSRLEPLHVGSVPDSSGQLADQHLYLSIGGMYRGFPLWKNLWLDFRGQERRMKVSHPEGNYTVPELLEAYCQSHVWQRGLRHVSGYVAREIADKRIGYAQAGPLDRDAFEQRIRAALEADGIALVHITPNLFKAIPATNAATYGVEFRPKTTKEAIRLAIPDKAPKDEMWLNPFGPLTIKAAKAAKPTVIPPTNLTVVSTFDVVLTGKVDAERRIRGLVESQRTDYPIGQMFANDVVNSYAWATVRSELANPNRKVTVVTAPSLAQILVDIRGGTNVALIEGSARFAKALEQAGITVIRERGNIFKAFPTKDAIVLSVDPKPYALLYTYSLIIALVCGTAGLPHILVRFYTNPNGVAAKRTTMWVMILIGVFYLFPPVFGVMGRNLLPELYAASGAKGTDKVVLELPRILNEPGRKGEEEKRGNISSVPLPPSSSSDGSRTNNSKLPWGSILSGITCAGAFAAFMSTFSGLLVSMTGALAHDVYGRIFRPRSTPEQRLRAFKISAIVIGAIAILLGMQVEQLQINFMVGQAFAIAAASYFPLLFMSCWWRGMTAKGAAIGMLTGGLCALVAVTLTNFSDLQWIDLAGYWAAHPLGRILCEQPAIWTVPLAIGLMMIVSRLTRHDIPEDVRMKMLVLHAPEQLGLKQEYIQEHHGH